MESNTLPFISALWLGILTSISPCPLATNIAAVTFIGKQVRTTYGTPLLSIFYTGGRAIAYITVTFLIVTGLYSIHGIAMFLQQYMIKLLGPILILAGILILGIIQVSLPGIGGMNSAFVHKMSKAGVAGALCLGVLFALSFCPVSAALFFGSVIPLSIKFESGIWLPLWYGIGTALPVIGFAFLLAYSSRYASAFLNGLSAMERYLRWLTGAVFLGTGIYFTLAYLFEIDWFGGGASF